MVTIVGSISVFQIGFWSIVDLFVLCGMVTFVRVLMTPSSFGYCYDRSLCRRNTSDGVLIHPLFFGHGQDLFYCRSSFAGFYLSVYCSFFFLLSVFLLSVYLAIKFSCVGQIKHVRTRISRKNELLQSAIVFCNPWNRWGARASSGQRQDCHWSWFPCGSLSLNYAPNDDVFTSQAHTPPHTKYFNYTDTRKLRLWSWYPWWVDDSCGQKRKRKKKRKKKLITAASLYRYSRPL